MSKFTEDNAEAGFNNRSLNEEFGVNEAPKTTEENQQLLEINQMRQELQEALNNTPDNDTILLENIDRANRLLDKAEEQLEIGNFQSRILEVSGQLINSITSAVNSLMGDGYKQKEIEQKDRALELREREIELKKIIKQGRIEGGDDNTKIQNNLIVTDRQTIMQMIKGKQVDNNS